MYLISPYIGSLYTNMNVEYSMNLSKVKEDEAY